MYSVAFKIKIGLALVFADAKQLFLNTGEKLRVKISDESTVIEIFTNVGPYLYSEIHFTQEGKTMCCKIFNSMHDLPVAAHLKAKTYKYGTVRSLQRLPTMIAPKAKG